MKINQTREEDAASKVSWPKHIHVCIHHKHQTWIVLIHPVATHLELAAHVHISNVGVTIQRSLLHRWPNHVGSFTWMRSMKLTPLNQG
jgi:hypothetical protein